MAGKNRWHIDVRIGATAQTSLAKSMELASKYRLPHIELFDKLEFEIWW